MHPKIIKSIFFLLACGVVFKTVPYAHAVDYIKPYIPNAEKSGEGRLSYLIWDVYDASLYKPKGAAEQFPPFALRLTYLRKFDGKAIADRSIQEMRALGYTNEIQLADWHAQMKNIFPDVDKGISLTGVHTDDHSTVFYKNGDRVGVINDPEFTKAFFDIWLDENTNAPELRRRLLGVL